MWRRFDGAGQQQESIRLEYKNYGEVIMNKSLLLSAVCACALSSISIPTHAVGVSGQGTWETTLQGRDLDGNAATFEAYYDTVLDITWLADANAAGTTMT